MKNETNESPKGALAAMAARIGSDPQELLTTLQHGVFKDAKPAEFQALVITAQEYQLNPILKELYAFPAKGGGIVPIVSIDGWLKIINRQPNLNGLSVEMSGDGTSATCTIHVKGREHPVVVTEYLDECKRPTDPWKTMPRRMLRHKAIIQAGRVAFGIGGIFDEDEGKDAAGMRNVTPGNGRSTSFVRDEPIDPGKIPVSVSTGQAGEGDSGKGTVITPSPEKSEDPDSNPVKTPPQGRQKKERHHRDGILKDMTEEQTESGTTCWRVLVNVGQNTAEMRTFSSTMAERLGGMIGESIRVTFTAGPRGTFELEEFEILETQEQGGLI